MLTVLPIAGTRVYIPIMVFEEKTSAGLREYSALTSFYRFLYSIWNSNVRYVFEKGTQYYKFFVTQYHGCIILLRYNGHSFYSANPGNF